MAISAGNYIIRSALDEDIVLLTSAGSKSKNAAIVSGSLTETDNRCYWKTAIVNTSYNQIYNLNSGTKTGYIMVASAAAGKPAKQGAYAASTGRWNAVASGNTMTVRGVSVSTYYLKPYGNANLYLTIPEEGGQLYLSELLDDTAAQEFYFEATTYVNTKLATPTELTLWSGQTYVVVTNSLATSAYTQWKTSSTAVVYEMRNRTRRYDMDGVVEGWGDWSDWTMISAAKRTSGVMGTSTSVSIPAVDNSTYSQADVQIQTRLTSAKTTSAYNKTDTVTHGPAVSGLIQKWKQPTFSISAPTCTKDGLKLTYSSDYTIAGNTIRIVSIMDGAVELASNYILTNQDYTGDMLIDWDAMTWIPSNGDSIVVTAQLIENNGTVSTTVSSTLTVTYDSEVGMTFTPSYEATDRMSVKASLPAYDSIECWLKSQDINGNETWMACEEIATDSGRAFEICPAFGTAPTVMWIVTNTSGGNTQWGYKVETLGSAYSFASDFFSWNWIDDDKVPHAYILKYRAEKLIQPEDQITLSANKFVTTGREYPIFRYTKSISRVLDVEGSILSSEVDVHCMRSDAEKLVTANHAVYRQPDGKWYQVALQSVSFERERNYNTIKIKQEAETR